jgi:hypothetical protein
VQHLTQLLDVARDEVEEGETLEVLRTLVRGLDDLREKERATEYDR